MPRERRKPNGEPMLLQTCPECGKPPKGQLDIMWFNDEDPKRSRHVCGDCWHRLSTAQFEARQAAARKPAEQGPISIEEARTRIAEQVRIAHVHHWIWLRCDETGADIFYCDSCSEGPNVQRVPIP